MSETPSAGMDRAKYMDNQPPSDSFDDIFASLYAADLRIMDLGPEVVESTPSALRSNVLQFQSYGACEGRISGPASCYATALKTLDSLSFQTRLPPSRAGNVSEPFPGAGIDNPSSPSSMFHLGDIYQGTRAAICNVQAMVACPCAQRYHMTLVCASIIMRILFWYRKSMGIEAGNSTTNIPPPPSGSWTTTPTEKTWPACTFGSFPSTSCSSFSPDRAPQPAPSLAGPFTIGDYTPDDEDQDAMRRLFFMSEIKTLRSLVAVMSANTPDGASPRQFHGVIASCLKAELDQATKDATKGDSSLSGEQ